MPQEQTQRDEADRQTGTDKQDEMRDKLPEGAHRPITLPIGSPFRHPPCQALLYCDAMRAPLSGICITISSLMRIEDRCRCLQYLPPCAHTSRPTFVIMPMWNGPGGFLSGPR